MHVSREESRLHWQCDSYSTRLRDELRVEYSPGNLTKSAPISEQVDAVGEAIFFAVVPLFL